MTSSTILQQKPVFDSGQPLISLRKIVRDDWALILAGSLFAFFLASILTSGFSGGWWPDLSAPYRYSGDSLSHAWMAQRDYEGWVFEGARSGYPFGSNFLDYPGSDFANHLLLKILAIFSGSSFKAASLFFLLSFPAGFIASYVVGRAFGLFRSFSFVGALLFIFLPFHMLRINHLFYTWYFVVPIFFYISFMLFSASVDTKKKPAKDFFRLKTGALVVGLLMLASFGVYYALFGVVVVLLGGILGWARTGRMSIVARALLIVSVLVAGVFINIAPNLIYTRHAGVNPEVAQRSSAESELYGFKLMQLVLPRADHRVSRLGNVTKSYNSSFPLINENTTSTLGVIGAVGLLVAFCVLLLSLAGKEIDRRLSFLVAIVFVLFMLGTVGGLGAIFSTFISSSIRAWNRISVFVGFGAILIFFIALQILMKKHLSKVKSYPAAAAVLLLIVGLYDQTVPACASCTADVKSAYQSDRDFVQAIESRLPAGAAVYQLPYIGFPETPPLYHLNGYQLAAGVLQSKALHWSFGGMKGRDGDLFYRSLSKESAEKQLGVIQRLGFNGIYLDRRGYEDNGQALIQEFTALLGAGPSISSADGNIVFFDLKSSVSDDLVGLSPAQIMEKSGYYADKLGTRYTASLHEGIDFAREGWPEFVRNAKGFSGNEPWGRWSDKNVSDSLRLDFRAPLPDKFTLVLVARAFASNANQPIKVLVGDHKYEVTLNADSTEVHLQVDLGGHTADRISFLPPNPVSPQELGVSGDGRKLGIGFTSLRIDY
ncbi:sugar translocase [Pseudomonas sp. 1912-s]|uniref:DUF7024 domain-containing protein n=1 Tax=Pseudomonas sp. 1912-s TaxID=3033802 RepID=UPI0023DF2871|nr:sugar translocase [Pseudomonas sp. 1912-s]MDF3197112.1 sugar translocase [Pseudomonas sp. 1912-s]